MIYLENDFYSNFNAIVESNDDKSMQNMLIDQISNLIAFNKPNLVSLFEKVNIKVSKTPTNKELSDLIAKNIKTNKKLQVGLAYLIAEDNNLLQEELKKARINDNDSFEGDVKKSKKETEPKKDGKRRPIDWNKGADAVTTIAGSISVLADTITQAKTGKFADDLNTQSGRKSPEEIAKEEEEEKIKKAKKKRMTRNIVIGVVAVGVIVTAIVGFKKGWFKKSNV